MTILHQSLLQLWFMQDGATSHTANVALEFLHDTFGPCVISQQHSARYECRQKWPPNSWNINPCNFVLLGYLKEKLFPKRQASIMQLRPLTVQM